MRSRIRRWGNSLAMRIPRSVALDAGIESDSEVELVVVNGVLEVRPIRFALSELLAEVTDENCHDAVDTGEARGQEPW